MGEPKTRSGLIRGEYIISSTIRRDTHELRKSIQESWICIAYNPSSLSHPPAGLQAQAVPSQLTAVLSFTRLNSKRISYLSPS